MGIGVPDAQQYNRVLDGGKLHNGSVAICWARIAESEVVVETDDDVDRPMGETGKILSG